MKKFLAVMILAVFAFTACNNDDEKDNYIPRKAVTTFAGKLLKQCNDFNYEYDKLGRCITMKAGKDLIFQFDYDKSTIWNEVWGDIKFNKQGYIKEIKAEAKVGDIEGSLLYTFNYNTAGQIILYNAHVLTKKTSGEEKTEITISFSWENNNLVYIAKEEKATSNGVTEFESNKTYHFTYGNEPNKLGQNLRAQSYFDYGGLDLLMQIGLLGKASAQFPTRYKAVNKEGVTKEDFDIQYKLNEDGTIDVETIDGDDYKYSYTTFEGK